AQDCGGEIADHLPVPERFADTSEFCHDLPGRQAGRNVELDAAQRLAPRGTPRTQSFQPGDTALSAGAPGLDALADPDFLLRQQLVGPCSDDGFLGQLFFLLQLVPGEVAGVGQQTDPIQLDDTRGNPVEENAVVRDGDDTALEVDQQV